MVGLTFPIVFFFIYFIIIVWQQLLFQLEFYAHAFRPIKRQTFLIFVGSTWMHSVHSPPPSSVSTMSRC